MSFIPSIFVLNRSLRMLGLNGSGLLRKGIEKIIGAKMEERKWRAILSLGP
jgi:hypothetical protein